MKKKVIFITQALWLGGIETALVNLINHLNYDKYDVTCLITEDYQDMAEQIIPKCHLVIADRQHAVSFPDKYQYKWLFNLMEEPQYASELRRFVWKMTRFFCRGIEARLYAAYIRKHFKDEHFHTAVIYSDRTAELAVRSISADRFLMFYHNAELGRAYHDSYGYRVSEKIIAVSENQCAKLKKVCPEFASKMIAIPNYVDVETTRKKAAESIETFTFPDEGIHLVSCGRLAYQKGFDIAVKVCAELVASGFIIFGRDFINIWAGKDFEESYWITLLIIIPFTIDLIQNIGLSIMQAQNRYDFRAKVYFAMGLFNLCLAIPLAKQYGGTGCAFATGLSMFLGNGLIMNWYYLKVTKLDILRFWKEIGKISLYVISLTLVGYGLYNYQNADSITEFIIAIAVYTVIYSLVIYKLCMNVSEKEKVLSVVKKILR